MKEISPIYQGLRTQANGFGENNDCGVKALAVATERSYADCHAALKKHGRKNGKGSSEAATALSNYAWNKRTANWLRSMGVLMTLLNTKKFATKFIQKILAEKLNAGSI